MWRSANVLRTSSVLLMLLMCTSGSVAAGWTGRASGRTPPLSRNLRDSPRSGPAGSPLSPSVRPARGPALQRCLTPTVRVPERFRGAVAPSAPGVTRRLARPGLSRRRSTACQRRTIARALRGRRRQPVTRSGTSRPAARHRVTNSAAFRTAAAPGSLLKYTKHSACRPQRSTIRSTQDRSAPVP